MLKSKYKPSKQLEKLALKLRGFNIDEYVHFLEKNNVVTMNGDHCIRNLSGKLPIELIYGFARKECENVFSINSKYENRIPEGYWIFSSVNYGDFLCLGIDGMIYHWDHEINDLYFSENDYLPQNKKLSLIFTSFNGFLSALEENINENDVNEYDEMDDPNVPFKDESLDYDFKHPELFFKNPKDLIPVYLKKLELSERGRMLLMFFKEKELIK
ncbi:SMI1/KNR4 family protein [Shigella flexneri]